MATEHNPNKKPFFQVRNVLRKKSPDKKLSHTIATVGIILVVLVLGGMYWFIKNLDVSLNFVVDTVAAVFGKEWDQDMYGHTNILIFGVGGGDHEGPDLTDSIMVMSIDQKTKQVSMLSIPRDLYVAYPRGINESSRINSIYDYGKRTYGEQEGAEMFKEKIEEITGVDVQYYVRIDFQGLVDIVDELGGIEVDVPEDLVDTTYPNESFGFETFRISKGLQVLDGETALKYARSRHSTSDFDRSARQQLIIAGIKKKALEKNILGDLGKLKRLFLKFQENVHTDLEMSEILSGAKMVRALDMEHVARGVLSDDPTKPGGFLYTPERSGFGGAAVLLPTGATARTVSYYRDIQIFVELLFHNPELFINPPRLEILNGTKSSGIASGLMYRLERYGFHVENVGNSQNRDVTETKIYYYPAENKSIQAALDNLELFIQGEVIQGDEAFQQKGYDITIVLGSDYKEPAL